MTYDKIMEELANVGAENYQKHKEWGSLSKKDLWKIVATEMIMKFCKLTKHSF